MGRVIAVCISEKKGTVKESVGSCEVLVNFGLKNDAHAGTGRQVSLLASEKVRAFAEKNAVEIAPGTFGENILTSGIDYNSYPLGTIFEIGEVRLVMIQKGKKCHSGCEIQKQTGKCIMPTEGVFAKVLRGGVISEEDEITVSEESLFTAAVLTASDRCKEGTREDISTNVMAEMLEKQGYLVVKKSLLSDDTGGLIDELTSICDNEKPDVIFTSGGTGLSPRDNMPEATLAVAHKNVPGIAEAIRAYSMTITDKAMLSRGVCVMRNKTLIINLPGSPKAVRECLEFLLPPLEHGIMIMRGTGDD